MKSACVVVGAGHAAAQFVLSLRNEGWSDDIILIGDEPWLPYHRPPLSKTYFNGSVTEDGLLIRPQKFYDQKEIQLRLNQKVVFIDRLKQVIYTDQEEVIPYKKLCLSTGSSARCFGDSKQYVDGIHYLRNKSDVDQIIEKLPAAKRVVIVGGGYIGLEIAASLSQLGLSVTLLEMQDRILKRVTAPEMSDFFLQIHQMAGIDVRTNVQIAEFFRSEEGEIKGVLTSGGERIDADVVIVGIGVEVNDALARQADLGVDNGILVDEYCQTSDPNILAIGDCTNHPSLIYGQRVRLESVPNAMEQAKTAAKTATNQREKHDVLPWFWSDQYDIKLQIAGLSNGYDEVVSVGSVDERRFVVYYFKAGFLIAADVVNSPKIFMQAKKMILAGTKKQDVKNPL